jgi:nucleoside-diphosphate-sugar epimerase
VKSETALTDKVLITGANGFVGRACCQGLLARGWRVRAAIRSGRWSGPPAALEMVGIDTLGAETDWSAALEGVTHVVHLAGRAHVLRDESPGSVDRFMEVNVAGTERLARMAAQQGVKRLVYLSSVKVHGEGRVVPYREEDPPAPQGPYAVSKWRAEQVLCSIAGETGLPVVVVRPPLIYGPEVRANFFSLLRLVQRGIPLPLAMVSNRRSLIYVGNLVDAVAACLTHPRAVGEAYLVRDREDVSTPELMGRIAVAMNKPLRLFAFPLTILGCLARLVGQGAAFERLSGSLSVDMRKVRTQLGWSPPITMEAGLAETVRWFQGLRLPKRGIGE